jgi:hypothetical protein
MTDEIKERVTELATINFSITKCPAKIYERFTSFCKKETHDNYSFGINLLLNAWEQNIKEVVLYEQYMLLQERVRVLEEKLASAGVKEKKTLPKTLGSANRTTEEVPQ